MTTQEKAAGMLDTSATAQEQTQASILEPSHLDRKTFDTLRARFARRGYQLERVRRADDGRSTYHASRTWRRHVFSHAHDLIGFLAAVEDAAV